jgi:hypothetical protein
MVLPARERRNHLLHSTNRMSVVCLAGNIFTAWQGNIITAWQGNIITAWQGNIITAWQGNIIIA